MCEHGKEIVLRLPDDVDTGKENRTVSLDECIAPAINSLWLNGIDTRGCCCGHNKTRPSIVIADEYNKNVVEEIKKLLSRIDNHKWDIFQWKLTKVG